MTQSLMPEKIKTIESINTLPDMDNIAEVVLNYHSFGIRAANIENERNCASMLVNKMYSWRGYGDNHIIKKEPNKLTLTATDNMNNIIGTITIGIDSNVGLLSDNLFKECINPYRINGRVCEFTKLAIDPETKSKEILASLFHIAFLYARDIHGCSDIFIEVNPRHVRFYQSMFNFNIECQEIKNNSRVDAPAVLLRLNTQYGTDLITRYVENKEKAPARSLFPYFFSKKEELGILNRLKNIEE